MIEPINLWTLLSKNEDDDLRNQINMRLRESELDLQDTYCFPFDYRDRFESIATCLKRMLDSSNVGEKLKIDEQLAIELMCITTALCYLLNSHSLRTGKYQQYDRDEIDRKLLRK